MKKEYSEAHFEMFTMPFGVHKGQTLDEIPASYLLWIADEKFCPEIVKAYVDLHEESLRDIEEEQDSDNFGY